MQSGVRFHYRHNRPSPTPAQELVDVYQNSDAKYLGIFSTSDFDKYEAEVVAMLHDEQCSSTSDDE